MAYPSRHGYSRKQVGRETMLLLLHPTHVHSHPQVLLLLPLQLLLMHPASPQVQLYVASCMAFLFQQPSRRRRQQPVLRCLSWRSRRRVSMTRLWRLTSCQCLPSSQQQS